MKGVGDKPKEGQVRNPLKRWDALARDIKLRARSEFDVPPNIVLLSILLKQNLFPVECAPLQPLSKVFYDYVNTQTPEDLKKLLNYFASNEWSKGGQEQIIVFIHHFCMENSRYLFSKHEGTQKTSLTCQRKKLELRQAIGKKIQQMDLQEDRFEMSIQLQKGIKELQIQDLSNVSQYFYSQFVCETFCMNNCSKTHKSMYERRKFIYLKLQTTTYFNSLHKTTYQDYQKPLNIEDMILQYQSQKQRKRNEKCDECGKINKFSAKRQFWKPSKFLLFVVDRTSGWQFNKRPIHSPRGINIKCFDQQQRSVSYRLFATVSEQLDSTNSVEFYKENKDKLMRIQRNSSEFIEADYISNNGTLYVYQCNQ